MVEDDLKRRFKQFALCVLKLCDALPMTAGGKAIAGQLTRCGPGANYRAACCARSRADFVNKLGIGEEEIDESAWWLELVIEGRLLPAQRVPPLWAEAVALTRITAASRLTAKRRPDDRR